MDTVNIIACTVPDWNTLVHSCESMFGTNPARALDAKNIPTGSPASYAMVMENVNNNANAIGNLRFANLSLDIVHITISVHFEDIDLATHFRRLVTCPVIGNGSKMILCLTLRQIRDLVNLNDEMCIEVLNTIYHLMSKIGFKSLFGSRQGNVDGSFKILK